MLMVPSPENRERPSPTEKKPKPQVPNDLKKFIGQTAIKKGK
jgi:hypothetical protein